MIFPEEFCYFCLAMNAQSLETYDSTIVKLFYYNFNKYKVGKLWSQTIYWYGEALKVFLTPLKAMLKGN